MNDRRKEYLLPIVKKHVNIAADNNSGNEFQSRIWPCELCLRTNGDTMPDLKQICKPCPKVSQELKPRKVINRLPDLDIWLVCEDGSLSKSAKELKDGIDNAGFSTSDVDPVKTIEDMRRMISDLKDEKNIENHRLPIDAHIIEYSKLAQTIIALPAEVRNGVIHEVVPYIPIHPLSLRKTWQYDDTAYNFVQDFLFSFTEFDMDNEMQSIINQARKRLSSTYTEDELYDIFLQTAGAGTHRRCETKELKMIFEEKARSWRKI